MNFEHFFLVFLVVFLAFFWFLFSENSGFYVFLQALFLKIQGYQCRPQSDVWIKIHGFHGSFFADSMVYMVHFKQIFMIFRVKFQSSFQPTARIFFTSQFATHENSQFLKLARRRRFFLKIVLLK